MRKYHEGMKKVGEGMGGRVAYLPPILMLSVGLVACGDPADPCQVNPTRQAADGSWVEADGEPLDDDPCDSDDFEVDHDKPKVKKPYTKPATKPRTTTRRR